MVAAFDYCLHGRGGAAPSIDTAMHGLVDTAHVDHLHPDSGIALATAVDGEALTKECFGDRVVWVPWRRPGVPARPRDRGGEERQPPGHRRHPRRPRHHGLGRHERCVRGQLARDHPHRRGLPRELGAAPSRSVRSSPDSSRLPDEQRRARAAALAPIIRGLASTDHPQVGHFTDADAVLDFCAREKLARLAGLGTSCPDHFLRTKVRPLVLDLPATAPLDEAVARLRELHEAYRDDYRAYYERHAEPDSPAIRGADPAIVLVPGRRDVLVRRQQADRSRRRRVLRQRHQRDARCRVRVDLRTDPRGGEVPHRVLGARGGEAAAPPEAEAAGHSGRVRHGRRVRHRPGDRPSPCRGGCMCRRRRCRRRVGGDGRRRDRNNGRRRFRDGRRHRFGAGRGRRSPRQRSPSAASISWSTTPGCRSRRRCSTRPRATGTSSTT